MILVSQRERGPWLCCGPCSFAMVGAHAGACPPTLEAAHAIAAAAGYRHRERADPDRLAAGLLARFGLELEQRLPVDLGEILELGGAAVVGLDASQLRTARRWTRHPIGAHLGVLFGTAPGAWRWWDPLAPSGWPGEWIPSTELTEAIWRTVPVYVLPGE